MYEGTQRIGSTPWRRSGVAIEFWCETCPNLFAVVVQQHKGRNFIVINHIGFKGKE